MCKPHKHYWFPQDKQYYVLMSKFSIKTLDVGLLLLNYYFNIISPLCLEKHLLQFQRKTDWSTFTEGQQKHPKIGPGQESTARYISDVRCLHRAQSILKDNTHPRLSTLLLSDKRYRSICCRSTRLQSSCILLVGRLLNSLTLHFLNQIYIVACECTGPLLKIKKSNFP